ncbi:unnamed protein product [Adineta steineri]|uniref:Endonuclease/exonuclease/phosphatase domain-containing protein n=1 Tax=Adineta steineri TaxID=433720 RepID=A0A816DLB7_9BILA|nr:unnamed protein product [Adineta steineri]CAF1635688.1 unnamed protein product [Adineta steineri]
MLEAMARPSPKIPVWRFDTNRLRWSSELPTPYSYSKPKVLKSLRVVSYNIWFDLQYQKTRFEHLCLILNHLKPHIICLQEMTIPVLQVLITQPWVQDQYVLSDVDGRTFAKTGKRYGVIMLLDKSLIVRQLSIFPFVTKQGRQLLFAQILIRSELFLVGTVHLESMPDKETFRSRQLQVCQTIFNRFAVTHPNVTCLLMGDFNFAPEWFENAKQMNILRNWADLWPAIHGTDDPGVTHKNYRFDRILFQSSRVIPKKMKIIGDKPIAQFSKEKVSPIKILSNLFFHSTNPNTVNVYPSDHFGLMADFNIKHI